MLISTGSPLATGLVFVAATLPNLLLSPIAGTFVDRWDHKETLIVSDILRAAIVLLLPMVAIMNVLLVYPMVFAVTTISIFFRPARAAILPQIVEERDLLTANSALWVCEIAGRQPRLSRSPVSSWSPWERPCRSRSGWTAPRTWPRRRC